MPELGPNVVVKLTDEVAADMPYQDGAEEALPFFLRSAWDVAASSIPDTFLTLNRALPQIDAAALRSQLEENAARDGGSFTNLLSFFIVAVPPEFAEQAAEIIRNLPFVEHAYVEDEMSLPAVNFSDDPFVVGQGYFGPAPVGVDVLHAWTLPLADGAQVRFVDVEYGWQLTHEDLVDASGAVQVSIMSTGNAASADPAHVDHGTKVLGIVMGQDNTKGLVGAAPSVRALVAPVLTPAGAVAVAATLAFILISADVPAGSVVLIEQQDANFRPVETDLFIRHAILALTNKGVIVVEASGNAGTDLDVHSDIFFGQTLNPGSGAFFETGAIIVTGASSAIPHTRLGFTNVGRRIDCYAWGENILTATSILNPLTGLPYVVSIGGSSLASAIVAGVVIVLQNIRRSVIGDFLSPAQMRNLLRDATKNTKPAAADIDRIGLMPNLLDLTSAVTLV